MTGHPSYQKEDDSMTDREREKVAVFRFELIAPILNGQIDQKEYLTEISAKTHSVPYYGDRKFAMKTIQEWLLNYRRMLSESTYARLYAHTSLHLY